MLNLFYLEEDEDRWMPFDRYPRRIVRRLVRGKPSPGGQKRVFLNLCAGLDRIRVTYRVNDFRFARKHPNSLACILGKPFVLDKVGWKNPILFGAAVYSHPTDDPQLLERLSIKTVLVPGPWMKKMCEPYWGNAVEFWPVGIDTDMWQPSSPQDGKITDVLVYDKVRWEHGCYETELINPILAFLQKSGRSYLKIQYGCYREEEFRLALAKCRAMIFLCEHETQGIAYQQALACGVPIFAWDRGGPWQDPFYYPHKVIFEPVTSVPYWDERCGGKFADTANFVQDWPAFYDGVLSNRFRPRDYILENLTLEQSARRYLAFANGIQGA